MQRRTAGLAAALGLLAFPQSSGTRERTAGASASVRPQVASAWVLQGAPGARTDRAPECDQPGEARIHRCARG